LDHSSKEFDINGNLIDYNYSVDTKINLYLPTIGLKFYAIEKESIKGYFNVNFTKVIATSKFLVDGVQDQDIGDYFDGTSLWGAEFGYGMEYFFDEQFSIGGEFGLRILKGKNTTEYDQTMFDPISGNSVVTRATNAFSGSMSPTYTKIGLNFYF